MSDELPPLEESAPGTAKVSLDFLPPNLRKHVDPASPVSLRLMMAKLLVPLSAPDVIITALYLLTLDPDPEVRETTQKTAESLPDRILAAALRDEDVPAVV